MNYICSYILLVNMCSYPKWLDEIFFDCIRLFVNTDS